MSARRAALIAAVVLGVALALVIALRTPVGRAARAAGRPHAHRPHRRALRGRQLTGPSPSPPRSGRRPWLSLLLGLAVAGVLGLTRLGARLVRAVARPLGGGWAWQVLLGVVALAVIGRLVTLPLSAYGEVIRHRYGLSTRGWGLWLRDVAVSTAIDAGADRVRAARPGLAGPPGAAHLVGLGGGRGRRARRRRVVPLAGGHRAGVQPLRVDARRASCAPTCSRWRRRTARRCRTCWCPTPPAGRRRSTPTSPDSARPGGSSSTTRSSTGSPTTQIESIAAHELGHVAADDVLTGTLIGALGAAAGVAALGWLLTSARAAPRPGRSRRATPGSSRWSCS